MAKGRILSEKQKKFCDYYIQSGNATESFLKAGYKNYKSSGVEANKTLKNPNVQQYITEKNKLLENERIADMKEVKEFWTETMRNESIEYKDRIKVSELIGKTNGAFLDRVEQTNIDIVVDIEEDDIDD